MVSTVKPYSNLENLFPSVEEEFKWSSIRLSEVIERRTRLDASVYNIDGKHAREVIKSCKWDSVSLWSENGPVSNAVYPNRFKRIYVEKKDGIPFYLPSQIIEIYPKPEKYISDKTKVSLNAVKVSRNTLLLTRSGTIGNLTYVSKTLEDKVFSDDVIRLSFSCEEDCGYVYAFLRSKIGQTLIQTNNYGAVIQHIEPDHLTILPIPKPDYLIRSTINLKVKKSFNLRDESNALIDKAKSILIDELKLPPIEELKPKYLRSKEYLRSFTSKASKLSGRLEATYHAPIVNEILSHLKKHSQEVTTIDDNRISERVILPGRFKRIYVEEGQGVAFFGGKELLQLDPSNDKFLSLTHHGKRINEELAIDENTILISRSGTIGKIAIVPKHWSNWVASEHIIRIVPVDKSIAGYIYLWLDTEYGYELVKRFSYGAVVNEIDESHVKRIEIPILNSKKKQIEINDHILEANQKRYEAYILEQEAIRMVNELVIYTRK